jgi:hypothetical protein
MLLRRIVHASYPELRMIFLRKKKYKETIIGVLRFTKSFPDKDVS